MISSFVKQSFIQICLFYILILKIVVSCDKLDARVSLKVQGTGFHRLDHRIKVKQKKMSIIQSKRVKFDYTLIILFKK